MHAIVSRGILETLLQNRKTAKLEGVETTGQAHKSSYTSFANVVKII
ncbi:metallopeptidase TldD-related protein [Chryseomicrobium palamuruense]|uniref:Metallopeptidase TldD-related protein n=1 Tax=Chryseomicrobium palamuruense TaxID=682973 RepID=A0ABV8UTS1_9BACL